MWDVTCARAAFNHLQTLSFTYFNQNAVGYIHARVVSDTNRIAGTASWGIMDLCWSVIYLIGICIVMMCLDWKLGPYHCGNHAGRDGSGRCDTQEGSGLQPHCTGNQLPYHRKFQRGYYRRQNDEDIGDRKENGGRI